MLDFRRTFLLTLALGIALVALVSQIQIRRSLEPLDRLRAGTESMKEHQFRTRVELSSGDEFEELADSFNQMAEQLGDQFDMLRLLGTLDRAALSATQVRPFLAAVFRHLPVAFPAYRCRLALIQPGASDADVSGAEGRLFRQPEGLPLTEVDVYLTAQDCRDLLAAERWGSGIGPAPPYLQDPFAQALEDSSWLLCPIVREGRPLGALVVERDRAGPFSEEEYTKARQLADQVGLGLASIQATSAFEEISSGALLALARSVDAASPWTSGHSERVAAVSLAIGREIGLSDDQLALLHRGGLLHDIGKLGIPSAIIDKKDSLTPDEIAAVQRHPEIGARSLEPIAAFEELLPMVLHHHERFDGSGYPAGLFRDEIPEFARLMAVADAFDAITSDRPYREGLSVAETSSIIARGAGSQFDPRMAEALVALISRNDSTVLGRDVSPELQLHRPASVLAHRGG